MINIFNRKLKLTSEEQQIEENLLLLLAKEDTDLIEQPYSSSILIVNTALGIAIEINGSVSIMDDNLSRVTPFRLSFIEHLKNLAQKEIASRYEKHKTRLFNQSLSILDRMKQKLSYDEGRCIGVSKGQ